MTTTVNFEIAKLLREKEFGSMSEPASYYCTKDLGEYYWQKMGGLIVLWEHLDETCSPDHEVPYDYLILAPTIAEVVMWLYEKHGIWIVSSYELNIENHKKEWFWIAIKDGEEIAYQYTDFNSPTEGYKAAIDYILNNLI